MADPGPPVEVALTIAARPETIFRFFTDPARVARWMGQGSLLEAEPGGRLRVGYPTGQVAGGRVVALEADRQVVFTWRYEGDGQAVPVGSSTVEITSGAGGRRDPADGPRSPGDVPRPRPLRLGGRRPGRGRPGQRHQRGRDRPGRAVPLGGRILGPAPGPPRATTAAPTRRGGRAGRAGRAGRSAPEEMRRIPSIRAGFCTLAANAAISADTAEPGRSGSPRRVRPPGAPTGREWPGFIWRTSENRLAAGIWPGGAGGARLPCWWPPASC